MKESKSKREMKNENQICEIFKIERYKIRNDFV